MSSYTFNHNIIQKPPFHSSFSLAIPNFQPLLWRTCFTLKNTPAYSLPQGPVDRRKSSAIPGIQFEIKHVQNTKGAVWPPLITTYSQCGQPLLICYGRYFIQVFIKIDQPDRP